MKNNYPHIFSSITVGNTTYKNRIFEAPATPMVLQSDEPYPTDTYAEYYIEKAKGGSANVCLGGHSMNPNGPALPGWHNTDLRQTTYHRYWQRMTDQIHYFGAKASIEFLAFLYSGWTGGKKGEGQHFFYSVDGTPGPDGSERPMLTREVIEAICEDYALCAENALKVGFDGILIHGGHGLVINRFMSPLFNKRTDEFGGSFENRCRFPLMVLDAIRKRVGKKLIIEYRISGSELAHLVNYPNAEKQLGPKDIAEFLNMAGDRIDIAHISAGNMSIPGTEAIMHPTIFAKPANNAYLAKEIKAIGVPQPVLTLGAFQDPALIEQTLAAGEADIVAMARGTIADPQMPNKAKYGQEDEIIPCIKCFHCLDYSRYLGYRCTVNPTVGREKFLREQFHEPQSSKKIAIIGGGPAGMAAAIYAKKRGHDVTIYEKADRLGGKLVFSEQVSFKYDLAKFLRYQITQIEKLGVKVELKTEAIPELIQIGGYDVCFAAVGADAFVPPIGGVNGPNVMVAETSYKQFNKIGQRVVLIGGGEVGCETALALHEAGKEVSIIEMLPELCPETFHLTRGVMLGLMEGKISSYVSARCTGISDKGVSFVDKDGKEQFIKCDTVVLSSGMRPRSALAESFRAAAVDFVAIGDCVTPKNVRTCTQTAYDAVMQF